MGVDFTGQEREDRSIIVSEIILGSVQGLLVSKPLSVCSIPRKSVA